MTVKDYTQMQIPPIDVRHFPNKQQKEELDNAAKAFNQLVASPGTMTEEEFFKKYDEVKAVYEKIKMSYRPEKK